MLFEKSFYHFPLSTPPRVAVLPHLDESTWKLKQTVIASSAITFGCPATGVPEPTIEWLHGGRLLQPGQEVRGVLVSDDKKTVSRDC